MDLTINEVVEYYYKYIEPNMMVKYNPNRNSWFYFIDGMWFEHSTIDILMGMVTPVKNHMLNNPLHIRKKSIKHRLT